MRDSTKIMQHRAFLLTFACYSFVMGALATPVLTQASIIKLDKPGLWLSTVRWIKPETGAGKVLSFMAYCLVA